MQPGPAGRLGDSTVASRRGCRVVRQWRPALAYRTVLQWWSAGPVHCRPPCPCCARGAAPCTVLERMPLVGQESRPMPGQGSCSVTCSISGPWPEPPRRKGVTARLGAARPDGATKTRQRSAAVVMLQRRPCCAVWQLRPSRAVCRAVAAQPSGAAVTAEWRPIWELGRKDI